MVKGPNYIPHFLTQIFTTCVALSWFIKGFFNGKKKVGREFRRQKQSRETRTKSENCNFGNITRKWRETKTK
jgi:hypothetical protein